LVWLWLEPLLFVLKTPPKPTKLRSPKKWRNPMAIRKSVPNAAHVLLVEPADRR
jgi:hypothetical protein